MGIFSKKSKRTTNNIDNRTVYDMSGSTFDNSVDSSVTDNSYTDNSVNFEDNSYTDNSQNFEDNSYLDSSIAIDGEYANNSGSIQITDGGAFEVVGNAVSDLVYMGDRAFQMGEVSLDTLGKTANLALEKSSANQELMKDLATGALSKYQDIANRAYGAIEGTVGMTLSTVDTAVDNYMTQTAVNQQLMSDATRLALEDVSENSNKGIEAIRKANTDSLATTQKLMTTISQNGNDLLIDAVVNIAKWGGVGLGSMALMYGVVKIIKSGGK